MTGHYCAVVSCGNKTGMIVNPNKENEDHKISFHTFPKNQKLRDIWTKFCKRGDGWKPNNHSRICSVHFDEEDYEMRYKDEMLQERPLRQRLSLNAIHVRLSAWLMEDNNDADSVDSTDEISCWQRDIFKLQDENERLRVSNNTLIEEKVKQQQYIADLEKKIKYLEEGLKYKKYRNVNFGDFGKTLSPAITENQINLILKEKSKVKWTSKEITKAFALRYFSINAYNFLRNEGYLLPNLKILQSYVRKTDMKTGFLLDVLKLMETVGKNLSDIEKVTVLMYDEIRVKRLYEYDIQLDEIIGPHSTVQVVIARGLYSNWKQVIFVKFDTSMTSSILNEAMVELHKIAYNVHALVSDYGSVNQEVLSEIGIDFNKADMEHPVTKNKICYFPDAPHLLKLVRDCLLNTGFILGDGSVITERLLQTLVCKGDFETNSKFILQKHHLDVNGPERQNVALAAQLLSHTVAEALTRCYNHDPEAQLLAEFIECVSDWFSIMNPGTLNKTQKLKRTYSGSQDQKNRLHEIYNLFWDMQCDEEKLLLVQKAFLLTITSLNALHEEMKSLYNRKFILTDRLNLEAIENLFSQLKTEEAEDDHPTPLNLIHLLRMITLGKRTISKNKKNDNYSSASVMKTTEDDTSSTTEEMTDSEEVEIFESDSSSSSGNDEMERDGFENPVGWIARRFNDKYPSLGQYSNDHDYISTPRVSTTASHCNQIRPSPLLRKGCGYLNRRFKTINKDNRFRFRKNVVSTMTNLLENSVDLPKDVVRSYLKQRTLIRIKYLNLKLKERRRIA